MAKSPPTETRSGSEDSGTMKKKSKKRRKSRTAQSSEDFFHDEMSDDDLAVGEDSPMGEEDLEVIEDASQLDESQQNEERKNNLHARMRARRASHAKRPGDQEVLTSKTILWLFGSAIVLLLVAAIVYALIGRNAAQVDFDQAKDSYDQNKYTQAIDEFTKFAQNWPRNEHRDEAIFLRDMAKIDQYIFGGSDWEKGLENVNAFIKFHKNHDDYAQYKADLLVASERIAKNSLVNSEKTQTRDLLKVAGDSKLIAIRMGADSTFEGEYRNLYRMALVAIKRQEEFNKIVKKIQKALDNKQPIVAITLRSGLLQQFPNFKADKVKVLAKFLQQSLDLEKSLTKVEKLTIDAIVKDRPERAVTNTLSITLHRRPQDDTASSKNRVVIAYSDNCCFGIDPIIGTPVWRRCIGFNTPFFPIEEQAREPALLVFDTRFNELLLLKKLTGELIWRQSLKDAQGNPQKIRGTPVIHDGQILLTSDSNSLYRISFDTGRVMGRWQCSQNLVGPPVFQVENSKLVIPGEGAFVYTLNATSFECESVHYTGHPKGSLEVPMTRIGKLVMLAQNDLNNSATLRVFNTTGVGNWMQELTSSDPEKRVTVNGQIRNRPILRDKELYVSFGNEHINAYSVSDDLRPSQTEQLSQNYLVHLASTEQPSKYTGPEFIVPGPNRQFWLFASQLFKFELRNKSIKLFPEETARGIAWHRPQELNEFLYLARKVPYSTGVIFTQTDRQKMKGNWRIVLGSPIEGMVSTVDGPLICVNDAGDVFRIREGDFANRKFFTTRNAGVSIPGDLSKKLMIFPVDNQRVGVVTLGEKTQLSIVNALGLVESRYKLRQPLEAPPVKIADGLVLPMSGRLKLQRLDGRFTSIKDFEPDYDQSKKGVHWKTLMTLDHNQIIATDSLGIIFRVQMQKNAGQNYLSAVRQRKLNQPIQHGMAFSGAHLFIADIDGNLLDLDSFGLTERGRVSFKTPVSNDLWVDGDNKRLFAEVGSEELHCFGFEPNLKEVWKYPLRDDSGLAGKPLVFGNSVVIVKRNGEMIVLDLQTGAEKKSLNLHEPLSGTFYKYRDRWLVPSVDGSLHTVDLDKLLQN